MIERIAKAEHSVFLVGGKDKETQAENYLLLNRFWINQKNIFLTSEFLKAICGWHYFDLLVPAADEVFIDCGCYDLGTTEDFITWCGDKSSRIVAFEPDYLSVDVCRKRAAKRGIAAEIIEAAVCNENASTLFMPLHAGGSKISTDGTSKIATVRIDDILKGDRATLIKMDIEGSEYEAILVARETIKKWKPTLALSIYHKKDDILTIPELVLCVFTGKML